MSVGKIVGLVVLGIVLLSAVGLVFGVLGTVNREVDLRNQVIAKSSANEATLDTMWKVIKQKAQITERAASQIKDMNKVYEDLVQGRSGGAIFKMVTENYPNLSQSEVAKLYQDIMGSVEAERKVFKREQIALQDLVRERKNMLDKPVSGLFLGWFGNTTHFKKRGDAKTAADWPDEFQYTWVLSTATKQMVATGEENISGDPGKLFDDK